MENQPDTTGRRTESEEERGGEGDKGEEMEGFECRKLKGGGVAVATGWTYEKEGWVKYIYLPFSSETPLRR